MTEHVDGNAFAGALGEIFAFDPTTALGGCNACGDVRPLAGSLLYSPGMGTVLRCAGCDNALITVVRSPDGISFSTTGLNWIRFTPGSEVGDDLPQR
jgi:hypothetical protein